MKTEKSQYKSSIEWYKACPSAYHAAQKNESINRICEYFGWEFPKQQKKKNYWTLEKCKEDALKYKARKEWQINSRSAYSVAVRNRWLDECCSYMEEKKKPPGYWTLERCKENALKYNTKKDWRNGNCSAHNSACKNGWLKECCSHMEEKKKTPGYWTLDKYKADALKYNTKKDWRENSTGYKMAQASGFIDECCSHMISGYANRKV